MTNSMHDNRDAGSTAPTLDEGLLWLCNEATLEIAERVERAIAADADYRAAILDLAETYSLSTSVLRAGAGVSKIRDSVHVSVNREPVTARTWRGFELRTLASIAALFVLVAVGVWALRRPAGDDLAAWVVQLDEATLSEPNWIDERGFAPTNLPGSPQNNGSGTMVADEAGTLSRSLALELSDGLMAPVVDDTDRAASESSWITVAVLSSDLGVD